MPADTNTDTTVHTGTDMRTKIVWAVIALLVIGGIAYASLLIKNRIQHQVPGTVQNPTLILQGKVIGVDAEKLQITVQASTTSPVKIAVITPTTRIEKILSEKNANGAIEKQSLVEVNVSDVQKGSAVTVIYRTEKENVLSGVDRITFVVEGNIDAYIKQAAQLQAADLHAYIKGEVVSIDVPGRKLTYKPYAFSTVLGAAAQNVSFSEGIPVYQVDSDRWLSIVHARTPITLEDIRPGRTVFIMIDRKPPSAKGTAPLAFILSGK